METDLPTTEVAIRLSAAALCGLPVGFEREWRKKPAGLRTHMLVSLAPASFAIITHEIFLTSLEIDTASRTDPARVIEGVIAGVAFLGAGTIIQSRGDVRGLTTGASIWLADALGLACGGGYYVIAGLTLALALVILAVLGLTEAKLIKPAQDKVQGEAGQEP